MVYYNEFDPKKAAWLRQLMRRDLIAPGIVDERSIANVKPDDLAGFTQCHFFAGIGVWSYALRLAGWPDDQQCWTGSCPCTPFSAAGKHKGFADERHLWPAWFRLIEACQPVVTFGEQVSNKDGLAWFDAVLADMDKTGYTVGASDLCSPSVGAPNIRQRLYFVGLADVSPSERWSGRKENNTGRGIVEVGGSLCAGWLADSDGTGPLCSAHGRVHASADGSAARVLKPERLRELGWLGGAESNGRTRREDTGDGGRRERASGHAGAVDGMEQSFESRLQGHSGHGNNGSEPGRNGAGQERSVTSPGATNGFWAGSNWVLTRAIRVGDSPSLRPVESGSFPLASGSTARVGRLRGYGDAINAQVARYWIESVIDYLQEEE